MRIGVIGGGVVGSATARAWLEHCDEVRVYDTDPTRRTSNAETVNHVVDGATIVFVCLPETALEGFFQLRRGESVNYVLRSTVPIGTTRRLSQEYHLTNLVHSPEFLTARCAMVDAQMPSRNIIGYPQFGSKVEKNQCAIDLAHLYDRRFPSVPKHWMSSDESEAVKLMQNAFFAVKVAVWNEFRTLADAKGLDWEAVRSAILADGRIHPSHTQVPGPDGKRGFGGACLPKDLQMLRDELVNLQLTCTMTSGALFRNGQDRGEA